MTLQPPETEVYGIPYDREYWQGIRFGSLAVMAQTTKLSSVNIFAPCDLGRLGWAQCQVFNLPIFLNIRFDAKSPF